MFLLCFSLAIRILCLATIFAAPPARRNLSDSLFRRSRAAGRLGSRCLRLPTATGPGCRALEHRRAGSRQPQRSELPRGGAPGESGPRGREARAQQPDRAAGSLELLRVRLPTSALGRPRPAEVRAPPAPEREGEDRPQPQPGPSTLRKARTRSCACARRGRK